MVSEALKDALRAVSSGLQIPTIIILIALIVIAVLMLGSVIAEFISERKALRVSIPELIDGIQGKNMSEMKNIILSSNLLKRQKKACEMLIDRIKYPDNTREALARQLLADEESRFNRITKITDIVARVAPMFGLMGTLIPLGPGLIALGQGDTKTLSDSLLIAFDTTVAGLVSGAVSYVISGIRKSWYEQYVIGLETIFEAILEEQARERKLMYRKLQEQGKIKSRG
ncbi:MAG: MotA/TolQ/ExbB proton channel family protein [Clostridiales bacterium]|nr:MotA/TolQ/ExbB proton channel family protein [Clostridiales bacterium]MDD7034948.1 MotA/TolQ/ExbB proton channel family protein [Bacillota bacterium]MDY2920291.1 MotA/TolQ/ExbB proton channel family protein [Lentihominibacter sp.]